MAAWVGIFYSILKELWERIGCLGSVLLGLLHTLGWVHLHAYAEQSALVGTLRFDTDGTSALFHYLLDNGQSKANTFTIDARGALKLAKPREKLWKVLAHDADARVLHMQDE